MVREIKGKKTCERKKERETEKGEEEMELRMRTERGWGEGRSGEKYDRDT